MSDKPPIDPKNVICVLTLNGREIGRIAASAPNAPAYVDAIIDGHRTEMAETGASVKMDYVEDPDAAYASRLVHHAMQAHRGHY